MPKVMFMDGAKMAPINSFRGILENILGYLRYFYGYIKLRLILFFKKKNKYNYEVFGHAQTPFSFIFYENENSYIIEDGLLHHIPDIMKTHKINPIIDKILHVLGIYFLNQKEALGSHKNIKKIYLTQENNHPLIKDKVEILNLSKLWESKTTHEKECILNIFNINFNDLDNIDDESFLLLTQPLSEDKFMDYDDEIEIYKNIINKFSSQKIIIKPHPRDKKNYAKIFPNINIIDKDFPIELIYLLGIKPKIVGSVVSNALLNFKDSEIYIYDGELKSQRLEESRENLYQILNKNK